MVQSLFDLDLNSKVVGLHARFQALNHSKGSSIDGVIVI